MIIPAALMLIYYKEFSFARYCTWCLLLNSDIWTVKFQWTILLTKVCFLMRSLYFLMVLICYILFETELAELTLQGKFKCLVCMASLRQMKVLGSTSSEASSLSSSTIHYEGPKSDGLVLIAIIVAATFWLSRFISTSRCASRSGVTATRRSCAIFTSDDTIAWFVDVDLSMLSLSLFSSWQSVF